jgi:hypothetical protein
MDYDVIYVGDGRNAVTDHRTKGSSTPFRPSGNTGVVGPRTVVVPPGARPTVITSAPSSWQPTYYQPAYAPAPSFATRFGMTTGELIDTGIQLLAAIQPLPGAPTAQGEAGTDVENLMTYQSALAQHAKRDEQLRTLGNLLVRILK